MTPSRNRQRGKETARAIARKLGGQRLGILGGEDVSHPLFSIEVKSRVHFTGDGFLDQAERHSPADRTPIAVVHLVGRDHGKDVVLMRLADFEDFLGKVERR